MKSVLLVSFLYDQSEAIGSIRIQGLRKYLPRFGWEPTVLTSCEASCTCQTTRNVIRVPHEDIREKWKMRLGLDPNQTVRKQFGLRSRKMRSMPDLLLQLWEEIVAYPDACKEWHNAAVEEAERYLINNKVDCILSSSPPPTSHTIAAELAERHGLPWIADFRDLWSQYHNYEYSGIRRFLDQSLELRTLRNARALATVSEPLAEKLRNLHRDKTVCAITNGFAPDQKNPGTPLTNHFSITYTGYIYRVWQDPEPLLLALSNLIARGTIARKSIQVELYGFDEDWLIDEIRAHGLEDVVTAYGRVPRATAIEKQRNTQVLLFLAWNDPNEKGIYTGKLFDYLSASRPILSTGLAGSLAQKLIETTGSGVHASSGAEIERAILEFYSEFCDKGYVTYKGKESEINKYSQIEMAKGFALMLDSVLRQ